MNELMIEKINHMHKMHRKIFVWGMGLDAVRAAYMIESKIDFDGFIVSNIRNAASQFIGRSVYKVDDVIEEENFFIVAVSYNVYPDIAERLRINGKVEFKDFIYYEYLSKLVVYLHGNCHCDVIQKYMESSADFNNQYVFYHAPRLTSGVKLRTEKEIFENIDIWIHQDIRDDNMIGYHASDSFIREQIPDEKNVVEIVIPNLYGLGWGFFPQNKRSKTNEKNESIYNNQGVDLNGMFCVSDSILDKIIEDNREKNVDIEEIIRYCQDNLFNEQDVKYQFTSMINKIINREKSWDIKISDYIIDQYMYKKLFYDAFHPTNCVLKKISVDILQFLGIEANGTDLKCDYCLDSHEEPVYPAVKRILHLEWDEDEIRKSHRAKKATAYMDFSEYIREYLWWCGNVNWRQV